MWMLQLAIANNSVEQKNVKNFIETSLEINDGRVLNPQVFGGFVVLNFPSSLEDDY